MNSLKYQNYLLFINLNSVVKKYQNCMQYNVALVKSDNKKTFLYNIKL